jgi:hypothetical protein
MKEKYDIFISYRREGGYDTAKHLNDLLVRDGYRVSFDIDTLRNGDFDIQLYERIDQCKDFILIVDQHAFDRCLDSNSVPQKDWLRCELAYALQKNKNIIPVFLSGANGFPDGLPKDIVKVTTKNGPEYNRYHFNAFYKDLKKRFLISRSFKPFIILSFVLLLIVLLLGGLYLPKNISQNITTSTEDCTPIEYDSLLSSVEAVEIVTNVLMKRPACAYCYQNSKKRIAAIVNKIESEDEFWVHPSYVWEPQIEVVMLVKEGGVWHEDNHLSLDMNVFYKDTNDIFLEFAFDDTCRVFQINCTDYLFFHCCRTCGGNMIADVVNDYVAINLSTGDFSHLVYVEEADSYIKNGQLQKDGQYPCGIEDYLLDKLENDSTVWKMDETLPPNDIKNISRDWFLDNPQYKGYIMDSDYYEEHRANVRMYNCRPDSADYAEFQDAYTIYDIGNYKVYSRWRGDVYAYDKKEKKYFLVWTDLLHYNDKSIKDLGNNDIFIIYSDFGEVGDTVDAVIYNLETHSYVITHYYISEPLQKN